MGTKIVKRGSEQKKKLEESEWYKKAVWRKLNAGKCTESEDERVMMVEYQFLEEYGVGKNGLSRSDLEANEQDDKEGIFEEWEQREKEVKCGENDQEK